MINAINMPMIPTHITVFDDDTILSDDNEREYNGSSDSNQNRS